MASPEDNSNWVFDFGLIDDLPSLDPAFHWAQNPFPNSTSVAFDDGVRDSETQKEAGSRKRERATDSKAYKEKVRRDKLNDRFQELSVLLDPERPPKVDKTTLLGDATRMVIQLRGEAQKLKEAYESLEKKVNELKVEKNELRDEKQKLKSEKDKLEHQVKALSAQPGMLAHPSGIPTPFAAPHQVYTNKLIPIVGYPGSAMWHFMPPAAVDTSEDHVLRPPVA